jgi:hypothetical protein
VKTKIIRKNKPAVIQKIREIAKRKRIKVRVWNMPYDAYGECRLDGKLISLNKRASKREILHTFFHELGHLYCLRQGIWKSFHRNNSTPPQQTFRIENWIEQWARKEWSKEKMTREFGPYKFFYSKRNKNACLRWIKESY